jgi:hypothetical protein
LPLYIGIFEVFGTEQSRMGWDAFQKSIFVLESDVLRFENLQVNITFQVKQSGKYKIKQKYIIKQAD